MQKAVKKVIEAYKTMSLPLKVSFWFFISSIFQKGISFISTPVFTRILSTSDYGLVSIYNSWEQIVVILSTLGLGNSVVNVGLVRFGEDKNRFQSSLVGLIVFWFLLFSSLLLICYKWLYRYIQLDYKYIYAMLSFCLFTTIQSVWTLRQRMEYEYKKMAALTVFNSFFGIALSLVFVQFFQDKAFGKITGTAIIVSIFGIFCFADILRNNYNIFNCNYWSFSLRYSLPMVPHYLSLVVLNQLDRIMIQNMCGLNQAGIYSVAYSSAGVVVIINQAVTASYNPWILERIKNKNHIGIKEVVNKILIIYLSLLCLIILFAPEIMKFMATKSYYEGIYVIPPVACSMFFILIFNMIAPVEYYYLKTGFMGIASLVSAVFNIVLNYIFILKYGYLAAGYTTLACYVIYAFSHWLYMIKCCRENNIGKLFDDRSILIMSFIVFIIAITSSMLYQFNSIRYMFIILLFTSLVLMRNRIKGIIVEIRKRD